MGGGVGTDKCDDAAFIKGLSSSVKVPALEFIEESPPPVLAANVSSVGLPVLFLVDGAPTSNSWLEFDEEAALSTASASVFESNSSDVLATLNAEESWLSMFAASDVFIITSASIEVETFRPAVLGTVDVLTLLAAASNVEAFGLSVIGAIDVLVVLEEACKVETLEPSVIGATDVVVAL